jgi:PAS domain S-box-containing protein
MERLRVVIAGAETSATIHLRRQLSALGHAVVGDTHNQEQIPELVRAMEPDTVLLATSREDTGWPETLALARSVNELRAAPVVIVAEEDGSNLAECAGEENIHGILILPVSSAEIAYTLAAAARDFRNARELQKFRGQVRQNCAFIQLSAEHAGTLDEKRICRNNVTLESVLNAAGDAIILADENCCLNYVNDAFCKLTGYAAEEVVGQHISRLLRTGQLLASERLDWVRMLEAGPSWHGDILVSTKNDGCVETEMTLAAVRDNDGEIISFVGSLRDIGKAGALARAKSEFLANVSHQLRTPVTNLKTYHYLLEKGEPEKWGHYVDIIGNEVNALAHLVQDVLEITELDVGPIVTDWLPVPPSVLVRSIVEGHRAEAEAAGLEMRATLPEGPLPPVLGSAHRLGQALNHIVENALLYTHEGQVVVGARLGKESATAEIIIWVSDTGPGIPVHEQKHVFDRFFRGHAAEPGHIVGTGLGLAVARLIVQAHRGYIEVESAYGEGSTFQIHLPVAPGTTNGTASRPVTTA